MTPQLSLGALGGITPAPALLDEQRGAWCTPRVYTDACGHYDLDPFTNPRSTLRATYACMLERGGDGFGLDRRDTPGSFYVAPGPVGSCDCEFCGSEVVSQPKAMTADADWKVWIQPDYGFVLEAIRHYGHTRFTALLRLDPSTQWFAELYELSEVIMVPKRDRIAFVPPPGVTASSNPFPHGIFYKRAEDVTDAVRALCYEWPATKGIGR